MCFSIMHMQIINLFDGLDYVCTFFFFTNVKKKTIKKNPLLDFCHNAYVWIKIILNRYRNR